MSEKKRLDVLLTERGLQESFLQSGGFWSRTASIWIASRC